MQHLLVVLDFPSRRNHGCNKAKNGVPASNRSLVYLLLSIFGLGLVAIAILQNDLNTLAASVQETATEMPKQEDNNDTM